MSKPLRSQPTRDRILEAARQIFCEHGYDRATIRTIAAAASIHPSMVMRYYGSKEGLFAEAVKFDLDVPDLSEVPPEEIGRTLVRHALKRWAADESELPALLRISVTHEDARDRLETILREQVAPAIARACGTRRATRCAALIATQMLGIAMTRYVLRLPIVTALSDRTIIDEVGPRIQAYIDGTQGRG
jgi:AcrR family transcriptional regulator